MHAQCTPPVEAAALSADASDARSASQSASLAAELIMPATEQWDSQPLTSQPGARHTQGECIPDTQGDSSMDVDTDASPDGAAAAQQALLGTQGASTASQPAQAGSAEELGDAASTPAAMQAGTASQARPRTKAARLAVGNDSQRTAVSVATPAQRTTDAAGQRARYRRKHTAGGGSSSVAGGPLSWQQRGGGDSSACGRVAS